MSSLVLFDEATEVTADDAIEANADDQNPSKRRERLRVIPVVRSRTNRPQIDPLPRAVI